MWKIYKVRNKIRGNFKKEKNMALLRGGGFGQDEMCTMNGC